MNNTQQGKEDLKTATPGGSGTLRHSHKKSRPAPPPPPLALSKGGAELEIREPSQLLVGVPATLTTQWRHQPHSLVTGHITYLASVSWLPSSRSYLLPNNLLNQVNNHVNIALHAKQTTYENNKVSNVLKTYFSITHPNYRGGHANHKTFVTHKIFS